MDVNFEDYGHGLAFIEPLTDAAQEWVDDNVELEAWQWQGRGFTCETRYAGDLLYGMQEYGLTLAKGGRVCTLEPA